ncbi:MAG: triose-phosphate isomerase [Oscillospiraceae bacterium]|nr:triose-phosphate isomerase [Oscillospiraceae bacterium]
MNTEKRRAVIGGNWKLNGTTGDCLAFARELAEHLPEGPLPEIVLAVPYLLVAEAAEVFRDLPVSVAVQNVSVYEAGAYTGEVSARQAAAAGAQWTLVGHSERRQLFGDTDADVARRVKNALSSALRVMLCVGEPEAVRADGGQDAWVAAQLESALADFDPEELDRLAVAYEPVWAIGTGRNASPADAQAMAAHIRACLTRRFGSAGDQVPVLYGGSVTPENAGALLAGPDVDGALVGGASLKAASFAAILAAAAAP